MNEKEYLDKIKHSAETITPPDTLSPEAMMKKIEMRDEENNPKKMGDEENNPKKMRDEENNPKKMRNEESNPKDQSGKSKGRSRLTIIYRLGGLAAAVVLAVALSKAVNNSYLEGVKHSVVLTSEQDEEDVRADISPKGAGNIDADDGGVVYTEGTAIQDVDNTEGTSIQDVDNTEGSAPLENDNTDSTSTQGSANIENTAQETDNTKDAPGKTTAIQPAASYEDIYQALRDSFYYFEDDVKLIDDVAIATNEDAAADVMEEDIEEAQAEVAYTYDMGTGTATSAAKEATMEGASADMDTTGTGVGASYSTTNVQEIGVDEGDLVKTDGKYIYILKKSGSLLIVSADKGELQLVFSIPFPIQASVKEMYVDKDRLSVIASEYTTELESTAENVYVPISKYRTTLYTYDISNRTNPKQTGAVTQDGYYSQSRKNGNFIYLFTSYSPSIARTYEESDLVPATSKGELTASEIYLPEHLNYTTYLVISSVNIQDAGTILDQKAVVSAASTFYASKENIYIANENWLENTTMTELIRLHYENGQITAAAAGSVKGFLNNSFSLNEYNGYLRVVSTYYDDQWRQQNGLYILNEDLNTVGQIQDLAQNETIRSARFFGDTGYFVTFRQTDPLFSVDLSDPANPRVLGALKVTGFSSYLHFYGENLLLGMGYDADENTGIQTGLKLSMFDCSDTADVKELHRLVLSGITWCEALNDYKMILIDPSKNLFGFACENRYLLFSYDKEQGFVLEFLYDFYNDLFRSGLAAGQSDANNEHDSEEISEKRSVNSFGNDFGNYDTITRGLYIDDTFYLVHQNMIIAFDIEHNYSEIGRLEI